MSAPSIRVSTPAIGLRALWLGIFVHAATMTAAPAFATDPERSTVPSHVYVVGTVDHGAAPDPAGLTTIVFRDPRTGMPVPNALVSLDFSGCCDVVLCAAVIDGQTLDCASKRIGGYTNAAGEFRFTVLGAAADPGDLVPPAQYPGCGTRGVAVYGQTPDGTILIGGTTAVCLDQNGAAPGRSNGTTGSDVSALINTFGTIHLGMVYKGRADINRDDNITGIDVSALAAHVGRLATLGSAGCASGFCSQPACP